MRAAAKPDLYREIDRRLDALLDGVDDPVAAMASFVGVLHNALGYASWTGFYRVVAPRLLRVGPYQGPIGCLEIPFGSGVCGTAAERRKTVIVEDVHAFEGHIACDPESRSEIVVPVFDAADRLAAVLDLDSRQPAAFDDHDRRGLELAVGRLRAPLGRGPTPFRRES